MNSSAAFLIALPFSTAPVSLATTPAVPTSHDVVTLTDGRKYAGRILAADDASLQVQIRPDPDHPPASVRLPLGSISNAQFHAEPGQEGSAKKSPSQLAVLWSWHSQFVHVPGAPAPSVGLQYAESLLDSLSAAATQAALELLTVLEKTAHAPSDRLSARQKRLRALVAAHRLEAAAKEARQILESPGTRSLHAEAWIVLGLEAQTSLKTLEKEHPRWAVDDRIRPQRQSLYFAALDAFLEAALQPEPSTASRALWNAARLYQQNGEEEAATACVRDVLWLYEDSLAGEHARSVLSTPGASRTLPPLPALSIPNAP